jgi:hypothetical protein
MYAVASIASVAGPSGTLSAYRVATQWIPADRTQPVKNNGVVRQSRGLSLAKTVQPAAQQTVPLCLLLSASQPPANDIQAIFDYHDLRTALQSGNLTVAQQAYQRLQNDLMMADPAATAIGTPTANNGLLDVKV